ncbi:WhiB family transcriptional regulator [Saccharopolyspora rhizosphaerae]|uniref:WhiB family transcriptional regulator n=1 Tax=Saccharopolyspora rhizosphaerae TaxID=2492662 RepID=A0A3R8QFS6_9PSEU|nr:WhiB family transcriptional regulator [Saccharopolyspora rhizosphaerae]RRO20005.1 WhiB family transcriptional regulator [Saccharopolyspora rhizosphaerae]
MTTYNDLWLIGIAWRLDRLRWAPTELLGVHVRGNGLCMTEFPDEPVWQDQCLTDRELAGAMCQGCPLVDECLELELRTGGADTLGVWGGMSADDRRELHPHWLRRGERAERGVAR